MDANKVDDCQSDRKDPWHFGVPRACAGWAALVAVLAVSGAGCGEADKPSPPAAAPGAEPAAAAQTEEDGPRPPAGDVGALASDVARRVAQRPKRELTLQAALKGVEQGRAVLTALYQDGSLWFFQFDGNLTKDGEAVLALLSEVDRHGLPRRGFRFEAVDAATAKVVEAYAAERALLLAKVKEPQAARLMAAVVRWLRSGKGSELELQQAGLAAIDADQIAALQAALPEVDQAIQASSAALVAAEVEVGRAVVRYFVEFLLARPLHPHEPTSPAEVHRLADKNADLLVARLRGTRGAVADAMRKAWPTHPQYQRLLKAQDRYQKLEVAGGWQPLPELPGGKLERGARGPLVAAVRARLQAEGYDAGAGDAYDDALVAAVQRFQTRHQVLDDGVVAPATVREMNVSAKTRLQQIRLALGRWREANGRDPEPFHIWVDVAAQRMQVYENGAPIREHRVIVGKDDEDIDYEKRLKGRINRTKLFGAKMSKITLAPRWYPTQRVIDIELGPQLAKDPDYYEKEGYVSEMKADGTETVYQRSGPTNLLGAVKFQFPNKHAIYMHDTPSKALFRKPRRASSHGCIRLENPVQLANFLLARDKGWTRQKIKKIIDDKEESVVNLKSAVAVYLDYVTVTVEEDDGVSFWGDVYGYDRAALTGELPVEEVEEYTPASTRGLL